MPLFSQESNSLSSVNSDSTIKSLKEQIQYILEVTNERSNASKKYILKKDKDILFLSEENLKLRKENSELKRLIYETQKKYSNSSKEKKNKSLEFFLKELIKTLDDNKSPSLFRGTSDKTCQYDGNGLRKTFESKLESGKIAYKWECIPSGTHTYWIVE
tara:strand:- start:44 stop:520 length:477 start_codon:yes stop_codon:yes gene_type:complete